MIESTFAPKFALTGLLLYWNLSLAACKTIDVPTTVSNDGNITQVNLNEEDSLKLLQHWLDQALGGLMGALATVKLEEVNEDDREAHAQCTKNATSVIEYAKCTVRLIDTNIDKKASDLRKNATRTTRTPTTTEEPTSNPTKSTVDTTTSFTTTGTRKGFKGKLRKGSGLQQTNRRKTKKKIDRIMEKHRDVSWMSSFGVRVKRTLDLSPFVAKNPKPKKLLGKVKRKDACKHPNSNKTVRPKIRKVSSYSLIDDKGDTPFGRLAVAIERSVLEAKHKTVRKDWITVIKELQEETKKLKTRKALMKMFKKKMASMQDKVVVNERRPLAMMDLDELDEMNPKELVAKAHEIEASLTGEEKLMREPLRLMREAVKIGLMAAGKNVSDFADKTLKLISPRLMPVIADEEKAEGNQVALLSPSLFALHDEGTGVEKATSLVHGLGLAQTREHKAWLNLIMEASGVTDAVEYLKNEKIKKTLSGVLGEDEIRSTSGQPLYFTKKNISEIFGEKEVMKIETFEMLQNTYTAEQVEEMRKQGFSLLNNNQLKIVYGEDSPYASKERLKTFESVPRADMHAHIVNNVRALAEMDSFKVRLKDTAFSPAIFFPLVFQSALLSGPVLLSPLVFSPVIFSPALLGPVIMSPGMFSPVVLSPRALSPLIMGPLIFTPLILSPVALHPVILVPGVFNPFILSPLALSPFILSPQVFSPAILSPFVLTPFIASPTVGSPLILSPFFLSPIILSPLMFFAAILNPFALSPLPGTPLVFAELIASPSWLS